RHRPSCVPQLVYDIQRLRARLGAYALLFRLDRAPSEAKSRALTDARHDWETEVLAAFEPGAGGLPSERALASAARWLAQSVPVVMPTETVYGLAAPALDQRAVQTVFSIK